MHQEASLKRSETSRRKIQSRFSVFTTSSQHKNPAPSVNPGTKQLWQTRCDISANGDLPQLISDGSKTTNGPPQKQTSDGPQPTMKPRKQTSDFINKWCIRNAHLISSTTDSPQKQLLMGPRQQHRRFEPLQAHHLTSLSSAHSALNCCLKEFWQHPTINESDETPGCWLSNKRLTASNDHTHNCCTRNKMPHQQQTADSINRKGWQQHHKWANLVNLNKIKTLPQQQRTESTPQTWRKNLQHRKV